MLVRYGARYSRGRPRLARRPCGAAPDAGRARRRPLWLGGGLANGERAHHAGLAVAGLRAVELVGAGSSGRELDGGALVGLDLDVYAAAAQVVDCEVVYQRLAAVIEGQADLLVRARRDGV